MPTSGLMRNTRQSGRVPRCRPEPARLTVVKDGIAAESTMPVRWGMMPRSRSISSPARHGHHRRKCSRAFPRRSGRHADIEVASRMGTGMHAVVDGPALEFDDSGGSHRR